MSSRTKVGDQSDPPSFFILLKRYDTTLSMEAGLTPNLFYQIPSPDNPLTPASMLVRDIEHDWS